MRNILLAVVGAAFVAATAPVVLKLTPVASDQPFDPSAPVGPTELLRDLISSTSVILPVVVVLVVIVAGLAFMFGGLESSKPSRKDDADTKSPPRPTSRQQSRTHAMRSGVEPRHEREGSDDGFANLALATVALGAMAAETASAADSYTAPEHHSQPSSSDWSSSGDSSPADSPSPSFD